jgi:nucleotide-binding universal stress UspA family protein
VPQMRRVHFAFNTGAENELSVIGLNVSVVVDMRDSHRLLIHHAQKWDADAIFVGGRRFSSAFERFRLGSAATGLVRCAIVRH